MPGMPKVKPSVSRMKKPVPLVKPIPPIPVAPLGVILPVKPGQATGKLSRPNPVVRRGKR
jgi:hypothetical protein